MTRPRRRRQGKPSRQAAVVAGIVAAIAAASGAFTTGREHYGATGGGTPPVAILVALGAAALLLVVVLVVRMARGDDDAKTDDRTDDMPATTADDTLHDAHHDDDTLRPLMLAVGVAMALIALGIVFFMTNRELHAQGAPDRGAFVLTAGTDTLVVDRFSFTADSLTGSMTVKGQPRADYAVAFGPDYAVRTFLLNVVKPGAAPGDPPAQRVFITVTGDSAVIESGGHTTRVATKPGAVPSINNLFAVQEIFTRRASRTGGSGDYPYLALNGGVTVPVTIRPVAPDSAILSIAGQAIRYRVNSTGRILGGEIGAQGVHIARITAAQAAKISLGVTAAPPPEKPDYSAPPGAPYTAEEVSFKGPGGITLGGTLTIPKGAHGPLPAALTITGSGQEDRDEYTPKLGAYRIFRQVADTLGRRGIAVLRLDDRGVGASTGDFAGSTMADFADDIRAGLAYLRSRHDIDPNRLALVGHSEGGMIGPMVAATDPKLRALVTLGGPGQKMIELSIAQNRWILDHTPTLSQQKKDSILAAARVALQPENQTVPMLKYWMSYDPAPAAMKVKAATLILEGATDRQVPEENAEKLAALIRAGGNKDVTVRIFPYTDHLFLSDSTGDFRDLYAHVKTRQVSREILGTMADWLAARLGSG